MKHKIIGAKVELLETITNQGGAIFEKGSIMTIWQSYYGYGLKDDKGRYITRVEHNLVKFID